jgi:hypothetical protein
MTNLILAAGLLDLTPGFVQSCHRLHDALVGVAFLFCFTGIGKAALAASREHNLGGIKLAIVRVIVVVILCVYLGDWVNQIHHAADSLPADAGLVKQGTAPNVFDYYRNAIAEKWSRMGAVPQQKSGINSGYDPITGQSAAQGAHLTHYGYDGDPDGDSKSGNKPGHFTGHGIGNHDNALVALQSLAISKNLVQQYNLQLGETVTMPLANGQTITGTYDDTPGNDKSGIPLDNIVDIYDPGNAVENLSGVNVTAINGQGVQQPTGGGGGPLDWFKSRLFDITGMFLMGPLAYLASVIALSILYVMRELGSILITLEIGASPIFLGFLLIPSLVGVASAFFRTLVSLALWPLGWAIFDVLLRAGIDIAINASNTPAGAVASTASNAFGIWIFLAVCAAVGAFIAPAAVTASLWMGTSGAHSVLSRAFGAGLSTATQSTMMFRAAVAGSGASKAALGGGGNGSAPQLALPGSANRGSGSNFALRPGFPAPPSNRP